MNENQQKQTLEMTRTYCRNQINFEIMIHIMFKEIKKQD